MYVNLTARVTGHVKTVTYGIIYHKVGGLVCRQRDKSADTTPAAAVTTTRVISFYGTLYRWQVQNHAVTCRRVP